jgi:hypothetical protein
MAASKPPNNVIPMTFLTAGLHFQYVILNGAAEKSKLIVDRFFPLVRAIYFPCRFEAQKSQLVSEPDRSFLATGVIFPKNPQTGETPPTVEGQCVRLFANIRTLM